jgi:hypothetical protein
VLIEFNSNHPNRNQRRTLQWFENQTLSGRPHGIGRFSRILEKIRVMGRDESVATTRAASGTRVRFADGLTFLGKSFSTLLIGYSLSRGDTWQLFSGAPAE